MMIRPVEIKVRSTSIFVRYLLSIFCLFVLFEQHLGGDLVAMEQLTSGTSSRKARQQAIAAIPFARLNQETRAKLNQVVEKSSIYRRLPLTSVNVDPDYFVFLVRHPEVIISIWQLMDVTKMTANRTGPYSLKTNDGIGAVSHVDLVYGTSNLHIFYAKGTYEGPVLRKKINGECVLVLQTEYLRGPDGKPQTKNSLDVFLKIDNATAGLIARTLNPIVGSTADHNFVESLNFLQRLNETTEKNGIGVQKMADRLVNLTGTVRNDFVRMAGLVYERTGQSIIPASTGNRYENSAQPLPPIRASSQQFRQPSNQLQRGYSPIRQNRYLDQPPASRQDSNIGKSHIGQYASAVYPPPYYPTESRSLTPGFRSGAGSFVPQYYNQPARRASFSRTTNQPTARQASFPGQGYYRR